MSTIVLEEKVADEIKAEFAALLEELKGQIGDDCRASDDPDDETPTMSVTFGVTFNDDGSINWSYQTGDNSYSGGAYGHPFWGVVTLTRDADCADLADTAFEECAEQFYQ